MPEINDQQLAQYQRGMELLQKMQNDPTARPFLDKAVKVIHPEVETEEDIATRFAKPHVEKIDAAVEQMTNFVSELKAEREAQANQKTEADIEAAFGRLKKSGYQDEGLTRIKELMVDRKIADPEAAAALFDKLNPPAPAEQPGWAPSTWDIGSTAGSATDLKLLYQDPDRWADREAANVLNEIRMGAAA